METTGRSKMKSQHIPEELITTQIITRLPIKSLVRLRCVCKSWHSFISNLKVLERSFFYLKPSFDEGKTCFYSVDKDLHVQKLAAPFEISARQTENFRFHGSCRGLLLFSVSQCIYMWNPHTRCCKEVLQLNLLMDANFDNLASGLCFDDSKGAYTVVMAFRGTDKVFVLFSSIKSKEWSEIKFPCVRARSGCFVNGRLHWILEEQNSDLVIIAYFDVKALEFCKLAMPPMPKDDHHPLVGQLGVVDGCLGMTRRSNSKTEILIMREYGVESSWTTIFTDNEPEARRRGDFSRRFDLLTSEKLLIAKFRKLWCLSVWEMDLKDEDGIPYFWKYSDDFTWETYVESLEFVDGEPPNIRRHWENFNHNIRWLAQQTD